MSLLHLAINCHHYNVANKDSLKIIKILLKHGADINIKSSMKETGVVTALEYAKHLQEKKIVEMFNNNHNDDNHVKKHCTIS